MTEEMILQPSSIPPMPDPYQQSTMDSAFASWCAALAYLTGRTQLGSELGKVAMRAKLHELRQGTTALMITPQTPIFDQGVRPATAAAATIGPWLDPELSQPIPAYTEQIDAAPASVSLCPACGEHHDPAMDHPVTLPTPEYTSRCQFLVEFHHGDQTYTQPCDVPIYLGFDGQWHHVQPSGYHAAIPRPQDGPSETVAS